MNTNQTVITFIYAVEESLESQPPDVMKTLDNSGTQDSILEAGTDCPEQSSYERSAMGNSKSSLNSEQERAEVVINVVNDNIKKLSGDPEYGKSERGRNIVKQVLGLIVNAGDQEELCENMKNENLQMFINPLSEAQIRTLCVSETNQGNVSQLESQSQSPSLKSIITENVRIVKKLPSFSHDEISQMSVKLVKEILLDTTSDEEILKRLDSLQLLYFTKSDKAEFWSSKEEITNRIVMDTLLEDEEDIDEEESKSVESPPRTTSKVTDTTENTDATQETTSEPQQERNFETFDKKLETTDAVLDDKDDSTEKINEELINKPHEHNIEAKSSSENIEISPSQDNIKKNIEIESDDQKTVEPQDIAEDNIEAKTEEEEISCNENIEITPSVDNAEMKNEIKTEEASQSVEPTQDNQEDPGEAKSEEQGPTINITLSEDNLEDNIETKTEENKSNASPAIEIIGSEEAEEERSKLIGIINRNISRLCQDQDYSSNETAQRKVRTLYDIITESGSAEEIYDKIQLEGLQYFAEYEGDSEGSKSKSPSVCKPEKVRNNSIVSKILDEVCSQNQSQGSLQKSETVGGDLSGKEEKAVQGTLTRDKASRKVKKFVR